MDRQNPEAASVEGGQAGEADTVADTGAETGVRETNRGRVRRLLLDPLGFRFPKSADEARGRAFLDRLADELGYMADDRLATMCAMLRGKGQGSAFNFWPDHATFIGVAEVVQPRPLEELPALMRWFGSEVGPTAQAAGELVETWEYIRINKAPPWKPQSRKLVTEKAAENARRLLILNERLEHGMLVDADDLAWRRWYLDLAAHCRAIVARERQARGHEVAAHQAPSGEDAA